MISRNRLQMTGFHLSPIPICERDPAGAVGLPWCIALSGYWEYFCNMDAVKTVSCLE
jgi:hypothetical protein